MSSLFGSDFARTFKAAALTGAVFAIGGAGVGVLQISGLAFPWVVGLVMASCAIFAGAKFLRAGMASKVIQSRIETPTKRAASTAIFLGPLSAGISVAGSTVSLTIGNTSSSSFASRPAFLGTASNSVAVRFVPQSGVAYRFPTVNSWQTYVSLPILSTTVWSSGYVGGQEELEIGSKIGSNNYGHESLIVMNVSSAQTAIRANNCLLLDLARTA
jgi:hypothetical protein